MREQMPTKKRSEINRYEKYSSSRNPIGGAQ